MQDIAVPPRYHYQQPSPLYLPLRGSRASASLRRWLRMTVVGDEGYAEKIACMFISMYLARNGEPPYDVLFNRFMTLVHGRIRESLGKDIGLPHCWYRRGDEVAMTICRTYHWIMRARTSSEYHTPDMSSALLTMMMSSCSPASKPGISSADIMAKRVWKRLRIWSVLMLRSNSRTNMRG